MKRWEHIFLTILVLLLVQNHFSVAQSMKSMFISDDLTSKYPKTPEDLQYAIDTASSGDTIELLPITYEGDFILRSRNPGDMITIRGKRDSILNSDIIINGRNGQTTINGISINGQTIINTDANFESNIYINGELISHSHSSWKGTKQQSKIQAKGTALKIVQGIWTIESLSIVSGDVGIEIVNGNQNTLSSLWIKGVNTGVIIVGNGNHVRSTDIEANSIGISIRGSGNKIQSSDVVAKNNGILIEGSENKIQSSDVVAQNNGILIEGSGNAIQSSDVIAQNNGILIDGSENKIQSSDIVAKNTGILIEGSRNAIQSSDIDGMFPLIKEIKVIR
jgi:hypothetical protein